MDTGKESVNPSPGTSLAALPAVDRRETSEWTDVENGVRTVDIFLSDTVSN